jgi:hypothetical protein
MMTKLGQPRSHEYGYLTVLEHNSYGLLGGYLIIDDRGRPLEFHCTAPVQPSRAEQILYGSTLGPCLVGEQIGGGLVAAARLRPKVILIDQLDLSFLGPQHEIATVLLVASTDRGSAGDSSEPRLGRVDDPSSLPRTAGTTTRHSFQVDRYRFELPPNGAGDRNIVSRLLESLSQRVDLAEPFERIHLAIREAGGMGGRDDQKSVDAA